MTRNARIRPSKKPAFRLVAFAGLLLVFALSYWLGNRYKTPDLPELQALLIHPAQPLPAFTLSNNGQQVAFSRLVDDWLLLQAGPINAARIRTLSSAHNRLADDRKLQGRFRVWLLEPTDHPLPGFFQPQTMDSEARQRLYSELKLAAEDQLLFLINPDGHLQAIFTGMKSPATMAADFRAILNHYSP